MKKMDKIKLFIGSVIGTFFSWFGLLAVPLLLLLGCNLIDWGTGLMAAYCRGERVTSEKSLGGIAKKIVMYILVFVGFVVDMLIAYATKNMQIPINLPNIFACIICVWLVLNELISITENCEDIGVSIPFLAPIIKLIKGKVEDTIKTEESEDK